MTIGKREPGSIAHERQASGTLGQSNNTHANPFFPIDNAGWEIETSYGRVDLSASLHCYQGRTVAARITFYLNLTSALARYSNVDSYEITPSHPRQRSDLPKLPRTIPLHTNRNLLS
ncbi:hypothetical protein AcV5_007279 [Taiwanofungus camphoratus]|nr:hypothetical protein AcV5_007279 [Antrodia cinnamomea]